jgi:hypothetical protein
MMTIFRLEARKYAPRWGLLTGILLEMTIITAWAVMKHVPVTTRVMLQPQYYYKLPIIWSRLWDGPVIVILVTLLAYIVFRCDAINKHWTKKYPDKYDAETPVFFGIIIGCCGLLLTTFTGMAGIKYATPIVLIILLCSLGGAHYYQTVLTAVLTILVIWTGETIIFGAAIGTIFAVSILLYTLAMLLALAAFCAALFVVFGTIIVLGEYVLFSFLVPRKWGPEELQIHSLLSKSKGRRKDSLLEILKRAA